MSHSADKYSEYRAFWSNQRQAQVSGEAAARMAEARREAKRLGQLLCERFGAQAVYLFGSLAWDGGFGADSDIDLAATGIAPERFFEAVGFLIRTSHFSTDLVDLDAAPEHLRKRILTAGLLVNAHE